MEINCLANNCVSAPHLTVGSHLQQELLAFARRKANQLQGSLCAANHENAVSHHANRGNRCCFTPNEPLSSRSTNEWNCTDLHNMKRALFLSFFSFFLLNYCIQQHKKQSPSMKQVFGGYLSSYEPGSSGIKFPDGRRCMSQKPGSARSSCLLLFFYYSAAVYCCSAKLFTPSCQSKNTRTERCTLCSGCYRC